MKVLVSFGNEHRAYMETTACAIRMRRPRLDVVAVESESLCAEVKRVDPALVIRDTSKDGRCARNTLELANRLGPNVQSLPRRAMSRLRQPFVRRTARRRGLRT